MIFHIPPSVFSEKGQAMVCLPTGEGQADLFIKTTVPHDNFQFQGPCLLLSMCPRADERLATA